MAVAAAVEHADPGVDFDTCNAAEATSRVL
jgi:hypothetical protein